MRTSAEQVPSLHRVAHRYLKLVTSSNFWPSVLMSALSFVLLVMIFSIPYAVALSALMQSSVVNWAQSTTN